VLPISVAGESPLIWTGWQYEQATIEKTSDLYYPLQITLKDQTVLQILPDTHVLVSNGTDYVLRAARKLTVKDSICASVNLSRHLHDRYRRHEYYWYGCLFGGGLFEHPDYNFILTMCDEEDKKKLAMDISARDFRKRITGEPRMFTRRNRAYITIKNTSKAISKLKQFGAKRNDRGFFEAVPPNILYSSDLNRKHFCRGLLDTTTRFHTRDAHWQMKLKTKQRLTGARHLFRSIGLSTETEVGSTLMLPKWLASTKLHTYTSYPLKSDIVTSISRAVPSAVIDQYLQHYEASGCQNSSGMARHVYNLLMSREINSVSPAMLRVCWRRLHQTPVSPIYDLTPIADIKPVHDHIVGDSIC
jgi:hypothetical protein